MWYFFARLHAHAIAFQHLLKTSRLLSSWVLQRGRIKLFMISKATNFYDFLPVWGKSSLVGPRWPLFHSIRINILWISIPTKQRQQCKQQKTQRRNEEQMRSLVRSFEMHRMHNNVCVCMSEFEGAIATLCTEATIGSETQVDMTMTEQHEKSPRIWAEIELSHSNWIRQTTASSAHLIFI